MLDATLTVKSTPNDLISLHKLIQLFLKVVILKSQQIDMTLERLKLLFVEVLSIELRLVALTDHLKLLLHNHQLVICVEES